MSRVFEVGDVVSDMLTVLYQANGHSLAMFINACASKVLDFALTLP
jgi:hypothetical protein